MDRQIFLTCIYSPFLNGKWYELYVLLDTPDAKNKGIFVKKAFQNQKK